MVNSLSTNVRLQFKSLIIFFILVLIILNKTKIFILENKYLIKTSWTSRLLSVQLILDRFWPVQLILWLFNWIRPKAWSVRGSIDQIGRSGLIFKTLVWFSTNNRIMIQSFPQTIPRLAFKYCCISNHADLSSNQFSVQFILNYNLLLWNHFSPFYELMLSRARLLLLV